MCDIYVKLFSSNVLQTHLGCVFAGIKQGQGETCIGRCAQQYGNRQCSKNCIAHNYSGGECAFVSGGATIPQCCCFK